MAAVLTTSESVTSPRHRRTMLSCTSTLRSIRHTVRYEILHPASS
ncbi:hypothetical protein FM103_13700 [Corynebacterium xerosis]|nr:hypothetical protein FM103_13700 [Corynebacterium xerosis]